MRQEERDKSARRRVPVRGNELLLVGGRFEVFLPELHKE